MSDPHDLARFLQAQDPVLAQVRQELAAAQKRSHWMWFVFPQLRGLGHSAMAQRYGLASLAEAVAYRRHPVLGPRLLDCTALVNAAPADRGLRQILGSPDDMKFHACMTLFARADPDEPAFAAALRRFCGDRPHAATLALLADDPGRDDPGRDDPGRDDPGRPA